jgi:hypothetical protein
MLLVKEKVYSTIKSGKSDETIHTEVFQMNEEKVIKLKFLSSNSPRNQRCSKTKNSHYME